MNRAPAAMLLALTLVACGGGGGGGGGSAGGNGMVPDTAPAPPTATYAGLRAPADLSDENVGALADAVFAGLFLALDIAASAAETTPLFPDDVFDETVNGSVSGTARVRGRFDEQGVGFLILDFINYNEGDVTVDGRQVMERLEAGQSGTLFIDRVGLHELQVDDGNETFTYTGRLTQTRTTPFDGATVTGSVSVDDSAGRALLVENVDVSRSNVTAAGRTLEATARVYDSRFGYVDVATEEPFRLQEDEFLPYAGGPMHGTGAGGRTMSVALIAPGTMALDYVPAGGSVRARSARATAGTFSFERQTSHAPLSPPVADAGASLSVRPGTTVALDARYSVQPEGAFLGYAWELVLRPPGSAAAVSSAAATQPAITLDVAGYYVLRLTASDGTRSDTDFVVLNADQAIAEAGMPTRLGQLEPDAVVGAPGLITIPRDIAPPRPDLSARQVEVVVNGPTGRHTFSNPEPAAPVAFDASLPGVYTLELWRNGCPSCYGSGPDDYQRIAVGAPLLYLAPAVDLGAGRGGQSVAAADLDDDDRVDLVVTEIDYEAFGEPRRVRVLYADGNGDYTAGPVLAANNAGRSIVGDANGDGRADIVLGGGVATTDLDVLLRQADGSYARRSLDADCYDPDAGRPLHLADINADDRPDIITRCGRNVLYFLQQADGTHGPATTVPLDPGGQTPVAVGDLTGDGVNDVVGAMHVAAGEPMVVLLRGQAGGGLLPPEMLPEPVSAGRDPLVLIADLDGDGRDDLLVGTADVHRANSHLHLLRQTPAGTLQAGQVLAGVGLLYSLWVHDFDADGDLDIGHPCQSGGLCIRDQAGGVFGEAQFEGSMEPAIIADIDGNGYADLVRVGSLQGRGGLISVAFAREPRRP